MTEAEAKSEFWGEISAWGDTLAQRRATAPDTPQAALAGPADPAKDWHRGAQILRRQPVQNLLDAVPGACRKPARNHAHQLPCVVMKVVTHADVLTRGAKLTILINGG